VPKRRGLFSKSKLLPMNYFRKQTLMSDKQIVNVVFGGRGARAQRRKIAVFRAGER
jgi:hypothetical protein